MRVDGRLVRRGGMLAFGLGLLLLFLQWMSPLPAGAQAPAFTVVDPLAPRIGGWTTIAPSSGAPAARHEAAFVEANGLFYLLGGRRIQAVDVYDPVANTWVQNRTVPQEIHHFQAVSYQGLIYLVGAMTGNYPAEVPIPFVYIYDPGADLWYEGPPIPPARQRGSAGVVVDHDLIYIVGGIVDGHRSGTVGWTDVFDPASGAWSALPNDMPNARDHFQAALHNGKIYALGGRISNVATDGNVFDDTIGPVDVYDIALGTWTSLPVPIPTQRAGLAVGTLGDSILAIGGESFTQVPAHNETEALDPVSGGFAAEADLNTGRHGTQPVIYNGQVYVAAGGATRGGSDEISSLECFALDGTCDTPPAPAGGVLSVAPPAIDFGNVAVGYFGDFDVTLTNDGSAGLTVNEAVVIGADKDAFSVSFAPVTLAPGQSTPVTLRFTPAAAAAYGTASTADGAAAVSFRHSGRNSGITVRVQGAGANPAPTAFVQRINAGGANYTDTNGYLWFADNGSAGGSTFLVGGAPAVANTNDPVLYHRQRFGDPFSYNIDVPLAACYQVNLLLADLLFTAPGERQFSVVMEDTPVLSNYDIVAAVGPDAAVSKSYNVAVSDGTLNVLFDGVVDNATVSALEVRYLATFCPTPTAVRLGAVQRRSAALPLPLGGLMALILCGTYIAWRGRQRQNLKNKGEWSR